MTPEMLERLERAITLGISRSRAADYAGISYECLKNWCRNDPEFSARIALWESQGIYSHALNVADLKRDPDANPTRLAASKFYLSTHDRESFADRKDIHISGGIDVLKKLVDDDPGERPLEGDTDADAG